MIFDKDTYGDQRRSVSRQEGRVQRGEGTRGEYENTLMLGGRILGHIRLYGERGRRGGGGTTSIDEGPRASPKGTLLLATPVNTLNKSRPSRGGAISYEPPPTTEPSTTSSTGRGGQAIIRDAGQETRRGRWSAVRRRCIDFRQTDNG